MKPDRKKAYRAALEGPEIQQLEVYGHKWNVKPASYSKQGDRITVEGQISHSVDWTFDDQIYYYFIFENKEITKSQVNIEERGWAELASPVASAVGAYFGVPIPPEQVEKIGDILEGVAYGSWEEAVHGLATDISMQAYKRMYGITAYSEPKYKGKFQTFTPGVYNNHDFYEVGNDNIASIRVPDRMQVEACAHRPGVGKPEECQTYNSDQSNVQSLGISYLYVENLDEPHHTLVVDGSKGGKTEYDIEVSEFLSHNAQKGTIQHNDEISEDWKHAHGEVTGGIDAYNFGGELKKVKLNGDKDGVVVKVDGEAVSVDS
jgi:hypothetical protein